MTIPKTEQLDHVAIDDLIARERAARDAGRWADMGAAYHSDSSIDISWFNGSGEQFTAASQKMADGPLYSFHQIGASVITVDGDRALADSNCTVHFFVTVDGAEVDIIGYTRLMWRLQRSGSNWLIAGLRAVYIRDVLVPVNPLQVPQLDSKMLDGLRSSYRFVSYWTARAGRQVRYDLPGVDKPETVAALRAGEQEWLMSKNE